MTSTTDFVATLRANLPPFLHAPDGQEAPYLNVIAETIEHAGTDQWPFLAATWECLASMSGASLRLRRTVIVPGAFFGVDPTVHTTPGVLKANRMVAAAANDDDPLLTDLIIAAGNSVDGDEAAEILSTLAKISRALHRETCAGTIAHLRPGNESQL